MFNHKFPLKTHITMEKWKTRLYLDNNNSHTKWVCLCLGAVHSNFRSEGRVVLGFVGTAVTPLNCEVSIKGTAVKAVVITWEFGSSTTERVPEPHMTLSQPGWTSLRFFFLSGLGFGRKEEPQHTRDTAGLHSLKDTEEMHGIYGKIQGVDVLKRNAWDQFMLKGEAHRKHKALLIFTTH